MSYVYSFNNGKIKATDTATGETVVDSIVALRRQYETTKQLPEPFRTRRAMEILGCWNNERASRRG